MLGLLRFAFAMFVVIQHLTEGTTLFFSHWGIFGVFGFYLISGHLMTIVLHDVYSFRFAPFALNRFLRLVPVYYVVGIATACLILLVPRVSGFHPAWRGTPGFLDYVGNALIFPFEFYNSAFRLVPPAWSLAVEIVNYFLLWLIVARSRRLVIGAVLVALAYHAISLAIGWDWETRYRPFYAALLPFALGSCIFFLRDRLAAIPPEYARRIFWCGMAIAVGNLIICAFDSGVAGRWFDLYFYINLIALSIMVSSTSVPSVFRSCRSSGKVLGDLSYPIFLTHFAVACVVSVLFLGGRRRGLDLFFASIPPMLLLSLVLSRAGRDWLEPIRTRIRLRAAEHTSDRIEAGVAPSDATL